MSLRLSKPNGHGGIQPQNKREGITFTAQGTVGGFSLAKSNFRQLLLSNLKRFWFPKETKPLPSGLKKRRAPRVRSSLAVKLSPVPPLSPPWRARKAMQEGRGSPPVSPRPPGTVSWEGQGWDYWFTVMAGSWGGDSVGGVLRLEGAKPCPAQSSCVSWQPLVERGAPEMVCPTPSYQQEHLWASLSTQSATLPHDFSLALQYGSNMSVYQCVSCTWSGWT